MTSQPNNPAYDEIPYPDLCHSLTHPGRMAAIAILLNMQPAPVETCRVLEIGCASGSNLMSMAYGLPKATFVGIDNSARQITAAREIAASLGLSNTTFEHRDILDITPEFGQFDYIVSHGIYSWVPPHVQDKLLAICKHNLAPQGVAYVSFNTLPGWHMLLMVREMMQYHTRDITNPQERAAAAWDFIEQLSKMIPQAETSAYASLLSTYLDNRHNAVIGFDAWHNSVLLHDELAEFNEPIYFHEFAERAAAHGLSYLAEADFPKVMTHDLTDEAASQIANLAQNTIELEQYLDFARHQTFRRTLLCHEDIEVERTLRGSRVRGLYISSRALPKPADENTPEGIAQFHSTDGATFSTDHAITALALDCLYEISPQAVPFDVLFAEACRRLGVDQPDEEDAAVLAINLLRGFAYSTRLVELLAYDPQFTLQVSERPRTSPLALRQVTNVPLVSNLRHEQVELDGMMYGVLPLLDGQHDRAAIVSALLEFVAAGKAVPPRPDMTPEQIRSDLERDLDQALRWLARAALLES